MNAVAQRVSPVIDTADGPSPQGTDWLVAAGLPTLLTWLHATYYGAWIVDDAGLTFAYARSLATGAGPVLQPGAEPVEGYSNPAWVAVLVAGRWLGLFDHGELFGHSDLVMFPKLAALLCCFGMFAAMFAIATTVTRRPVLLTMVAGGATAAVPSFVIWTTSGLENALFALTVMWLAAVLVRAVPGGRPPTTHAAVAGGALAALAALTRPDGVIYVLALPLAVVLTVRRPTLRRTVTVSLVSVAAFAVPVGAYLVWRLVAFGDYLPNTARAKEQALPTLTDLNKPVELVGYVGWLAAVLAVAVIVLALSRPSAARPVLATLLVPLGLAVVGYAVLEPDWMAQYRFATPVWPLGAMVVAVSAVVVLRDTSTRRRVAATVAAAMAGVLTLSGFMTSANAFRGEPTVGLCNVAQNTGYLVNGYADILAVRDGNLLAVDGGGSSLSTRLRFVDLSGLADKRIARFWQKDDMSGLRDYVFDEVRPTFIRLFAGWDHLDRVALTQDPRLHGGYVLLWSARPGGGDWVRRDAAANLSALDAARQWGRDSIALIDDRYEGVVPPVWWCGDVIRPTAPGAGTPAQSPLTPPKI